MLLRACRQALQQQTDSKGRTRWKTFLRLLKRCCFIFSLNTVGFCKANIYLNSYVEIYIKTKLIAELCGKNIYSVIGKSFIFRPLFYGMLAQSTKASFSYRQVRLYQRQENIFLYSKYFIQGSYGLIQLYFFWHARNKLCSKGCKLLPGITWR